MSELVHFGVIVTVGAGAFLAAVLLTRVAERIRIPAGALFLIAAAVASDLVPRLGDVSTRTVERVASLALVVILFDGGMRIGWRTLRVAWVPVLSLGLLGTFVTAALVALAARYALGVGWTTAGLVGAAIAPTDPAIMFSVLGRREIVGRTGTILEGESGANDPVGIALMLALVEYARGHGSGAAAVGDFVLSLAIGVVVGVAAAYAHRVLVRIPLPDQSLVPLATLTFAGLVFGAASALHGSGFLAVFIAGLLIGDRTFAGRRAVGRFHTSLASLAEIVVFIALGLTVDIESVFHGGVWRDGVILTLILVFVARPLAAWPLLYPVRLRRAEEAFVVWAGLKGAVPILLASFALAANVAEAERIYGIVFVVVAFSVTVQAATIPWAAHLCRIPMRRVEDEPWD